MESGEKPKTDSGHSRWTGGGDKKEGNLLRRLVLGGPKSRGSLYTRISICAVRVLEVYIETSRGSRDAYQPHGPRSTSLARLLPPNGSGFGNRAGKCTRAGEGPGASHPALGSMGGHGLWMTSSGIKCNQFTHQV